jgi:TIR domain
MASKDTITSFCELYVRATKIASCPGEVSLGVFISYSRKDGTEFAAQLPADLSARTLSVWQDTASLEGGRDWWSQFEDAIAYRLLTCGSS